ncbi:unnamed protein product, partial [Brassica oleracea]
MDEEKHGIFFSSTGSESFDLYTFGLTCLSMYVSAFWASVLQPKLLGLCGRRGDKLMYGVTDCIDYSLSLRKA